MHNNTVNHSELSSKPLTQLHRYSYFCCVRIIMLISQVAGVRCVHHGQAMSLATLVAPMLLLNRCCCNVVSADCWCKLLLLQCVAASCCCRNLCEWLIRLHADQKPQATCTTVQNCFRIRTSHYDLTVFDELTQNMEKPEFNGSIDTKYAFAIACHHMSSVEQNTNAK